MVTDPTWHPRARQPANDRQAVIDRHELLTEFLRFFEMEEDAISRDVEGMEPHVSQATRNALRPLTGILREAPDSGERVLKHLSEQADSPCPALIIPVESPILRFQHAMKSFPVIVLSLFSSSLIAAELGQVSGVEAQPLIAQTKRLIEALEFVGTPLAAARKQALERALSGENDAAVSTAIQAVLDPLCLAGVIINPESRVKVVPGPAKPVLVEGGWTVFLIKVHNEAGVTAPLLVQSPNARSMHNSPKEDLPDRWLDLATMDRQPLTRTLGGLELEYRILSLYSRDRGKREGKLQFDVGQGTQDLGFRNESNILFTCRPAHEVGLEVLDENGKPTTAAFEIRDHLGRVYPSQSKRAAPDFAFHPQIYRAHGETIRLPTGTYTIRNYRGPESLPQERQLEVDQNTGKLSFKIRRWIDPSLMGWWSGDHHIHAAGCAHYTNPTEGVHAPDMMRHCLGEDLKVGCNLTWGPCFDYQKKFFTGKDDKVSRYPYLLRYDIEVSGFGSHQSGHLCLLRLKDQMYPGGDSKHHWPKLCLNTLRWAKKQGALVGPAHSGWGLSVPGDELPNYNPPPFDGIGANEYIVDVTHTVEGPDGRQVPAVDFLSMVDTPYLWELNIWYHTLNCGFRTRISGETDFPCIYGERVGLGRSYVKLENKLTFDKWCEGIRQGRNYVGDGRSHLIGFQINDIEMGVGDSNVRLDRPGKVTTRVRAAAFLPEKPYPGIRDLPYQKKPYWHIERSRLGDSRDVTVEILVNGKAVAQRRLHADGSLKDLAFEVPIERSSWVAARILPSSHTNPVWVTVADKPVRASRRSAEWCLRGVNDCWKQKEKFIDQDELDDARKAYDHARNTYQRIIDESEIR